MFGKKYKEALVEDVVSEVQNDMCSYSALPCPREEFALDCVRQVVSRWDDSELARWFGREFKDTKCLVKDNIDCYADIECEHVES